MKTWLECTDALKAGKTLVHLSKRDAYLKKDGNLNSDWCFIHPENWHIKEDWRDTVSPENPVLCYVSDVEDFRGICAREVTEYVKSSDSPYRTAGCPWRYARPLTKSEILKLMQNVPDE